MTTIVTTLPIKIPTTIIEEQCKWGVLVNFTSSFSNLTSEDIYDFKIQNIINTYCTGGSSVVIKGQEGNFQVTTTRNEIRSTNNMAKVNLTECENKLKEEYDIDQNLDLIILKYIKNDDQSIQYEIYHPITHEKLDLSYCENTKADMYIPIEMDEKTEEVYNDIKDQGYDPLDLNDKFYREICTPYTSENGTDVLLDDREEFIYTSIVNQSVCPSGCDYDEFIYDKKYIKCECDTNTSGIETLDIEHLTGKNIGNSFLSTLQSTNWKVMRCYNLVFNFKIFKHNYGSIFILILFIIYIFFMIYFCMRNITPLKVEVSKMLFEEKKNENEMKIIDYYETKKGIKEKIKVKYPPKKIKNKNVNVINDKDYDNKGIMTENKDLITKKRRSEKRKMKETNLSLKSSRKTILSDKKEKKKDKDKNIDKNKENERKIYDNFELNNLDYEDACKLDKRTCCRTYLSVLMREHNALHTFLSWKDYNLFYVKIEKFFIYFVLI